MIIKNLCLENFKNIKSMNLDFSPGTNVIAGDNAQGKTNILEAVWIFSGAKSFRGSKDSEYIKFSEEGARLAISFKDNFRDKTAAVNFFKDNKKEVYLNDIKLTSVSKLAGEFLVVIFSPDHLQLVKEGPSFRRSMIDGFLSQVFPKYMHILESYNKILKQRAVVLQDLQKNYSIIDMLDIWDESLADYGSYIVYTRKEYVKKLFIKAREIYSDISSGKEILSVAYRSSIGDIEEFNRNEIKDIYFKRIKEKRKDDINAGATLTGPHRDDMEIEIDGVSARSFGSQGQQRSCVLALKLAECGIIKDIRSENPVVLLDDVMSELDENRRHYLLNNIKDKQVIITCCNSEIFKENQNIRRFFIKDGRISGE